VEFTARNMTVICPCGMTVRHCHCEMEHEPHIHMGVYLAAAWTEQERMQGYRRILERLGFSITSRWIDHTDKQVMHAAEIAHDPDAALLGATEDVEDIADADGVIFFHDVPSTSGGRHVEFGLALGAGKSIIIVGPRENVFHSLPGVEQFDTWDQLLTFLRSNSASTTRRA
jgi:hypothetical protein